MFQESLYKSDLFSRIYQQSAHKYDQMQSIPVQINQRSLIVSILHMFLGMSSPIFPINNKYQSYFAITNQPIVMKHLTLDTLRRTIDHFVQIGNQMRYIRHQTRRILDLKNSLLRAFAEGSHKFMMKIQVQITQMLRYTQQERGHLPRKEYQFQSRKDTPMTLLSLTNIMKKHESSIGYLVSVINKLCLNDKPCIEQQQKCIPLLLNLYYQQCEQQYCGRGIGKNFHVLYKNLLVGYLQICKKWLQADENTLILKKNVGFFLTQDTKTNDHQKLFNIQKLICKEKIPQQFLSSYAQLTQLAKTIQFIQLYFNEQELQTYKILIDIDRQFEPILAFIDSLASQPVQEYRFFNPKQFKPISISQRLARQKKPQIRQPQPPEDDPYGIFSKTIQFFHLRSQYTYPEPPTLAIHSSSYSDSPKTEEGASINMTINRLLQEMLARINKKCVDLLSRQTIRDSIERTMKGIKKFMLFEQGDFVQQFLQISQETLNKTSQKITRNKVQRLIQEAIKSSGAKNQSQSLLQNVSFVFLKSQNGGLKGWRVFSIMYKPEPPTNSIFTSKVMESYGYVSNLLYNLRRCEQITVSVWQNYLTEGMGSILKARNAVHHFTKALQAYIFTIIEDLWSELTNTIKETGNIFAIIEANQRILQKMKSLTIENRGLCNCMLSLVKVVQRFESMHQSLIEGEEGTVKQDLQKIWSWFMSMLDQAKQINNFSQGFSFQSDLLY